MAKASAKVEFKFITYKAVMDNQVRLVPVPLDLCCESNTMAYKKKNSFEKWLTKCIISGHSYPLNLSHHLRPRPEIMKKKVKNWIFQIHFEEKISTYFEILFNILENSILGKGFFKKLELCLS